MTVILGKAFSGVNLLKAHKLIFITNLIITLCILALYIPDIYTHIELGLNRYVFTDDVSQQIWPFYGYRLNRYIADDYIARYYLACFPFGYKLLYIASAFIFDPVSLSKALPYLLLIITAVFVALSVYKYTDFLSALFSVALLLSASIFMERMAGGLPRAFAFPLSAFLLYAVISDKRFTLLCAVTLLAALFYPPIAVLSGTLIAVLAVLPQSFIKHEIKLASRIRYVFFTGILTVTFLMPVYLGASAYGPTIKSSDTTNYPELGPGGRYGPEDRPPWPALRETIRTNSSVLFSSSRLSVFKKTKEFLKDNHLYCKSYRFLAILVLMAGLITALVSPKLRAIPFLFLVTAAIYRLSVEVSPYLYLPQRYTRYTLPVLTLFFLSVLPYLALNKFMPSKSSLKYFLNATVLLFIYLLYGSNFHSAAGYNIRVSEPDTKLTTFIESLPEKSLVAGWPLGVTNYIPYLSKRAVLTSHETYQVFHAGYVSTMRTRTYALLKALCSRSEESIKNLQENFGVTHLVLDRAVLSVKKPPKYIKPYNKLIRKYFKPLRNQELNSLSAMGFKIIYDDGRYLVLRLSAAT
ncbi:MAG: hypothetical protein D6719_02025 [Candidatus Dadabacteria bacterium]|nr:MAG: hypothetical protein D6719_02025 [Candidatus Dadabacteria bacterium]